jgi:hypothetical protein
MSDTINIQRQSSVPEGMHVFVITDVDVTMPDSGHPNWKFTLELREGQPTDGQTMLYNVSHSPAARWKAEEFLDATKAPDGNQDVSMYDFIGQTVRGTVKMGEYQGKQRANIDSLLPHPDAKPLEVGKSAQKATKNFAPTLPNTEVAPPSATPTPTPAAPVAKTETTEAPPAEEPAVEPTPPAPPVTQETEPKHKKLF